MAAFLFEDSLKMNNFKSLFIRLAIKNHYTMKNKEKQLYEAPSTGVIEVAYEGIVCQSIRTAGDPEFNGFNDEEEW